MKLIILSFLFCSKVLALNLSYTLIDLDSGKVVAKKNEVEPQSLASVSKLFTSYYVLKNKDSNYSFNTSIFVDGDIKEGVLNGDMYLKANGNPYLTIQDLLSLIGQIKLKGISEVKGKFFVVNEIGLQKERISNLGLEDQADNSSMGALNVEFNRFRYLKQYKSFSPPLSYIRKKELEGKGNGLIFKSLNTSKGEETWGVYKEEKKKYTEEIPVKNNDLFGGHLFQKVASLNGLLLKNPIQTKKTNGREIATHKGLPLWRLTQLCLEYSNNLIAEMLLFSVTQNNPLSGAKKMQAWIKNRYQSINWDSLNLVNGSGLDLNSKVSALALTSWLSTVSNDVIQNRSFKSYLSINGHSGGISRRLKDPKLAYRVYAKTGSFFYINNLAGYLTGDSGKQYAFTIFSSDKKNREILSLPNSSKVNKVRQGAKAWKVKSSQSIDTLLKNWIEKY